MNALPAGVSLSYGTDAQGEPVVHLHAEGAGPNSVHIVGTIDDMEALFAEGWRLCQELRRCVGRAAVAGCR